MIKGSTKGTGTTLSHSCCFKRTNPSEHGNTRIRKPIVQCWIDFFRNPFLLHESFVGLSGPSCCIAQIWNTHSDLWSSSSDTLTGLLYKPHLLHPHSQHTAYSCLLRFHECNSSGRVKPRRHRLKEEESDSSLGYPAIESLAHNPVGKMLDKDKDKETA